MEKNAVLKQVYQYTKAGQFLKVLEYINDDKINDESALNILIYAANACCDSKNFSQKLTEKDIYELLKHVIPNIKRLKQSHLETYLKSIFHILKILVDREDYEDLAKVEFVVLPDFLNEFELRDIKEAKFIYQQIVSKFFNSIYNVAKTRNTSQYQHMMDIIRITLKANFQINDNKNTLILAKKLLSSIEYMGFQSYNLEKFYVILIQTLNVTQSCQSKCDPEELILLLEIFAQVICSFIKEKKFDSAEHFLSCVVKLNSDELFESSHRFFLVITGLFPTHFEELLNNLTCSKDLMKSVIKHEQLFYSIIVFLEESLSLLLSLYRTEYLKTWCTISTNSFMSFIIFFKEEIFEYWSGSKISSAYLVERKLKSILTTGWQIHKLIINYMEQNKDLSKSVYELVNNWLRYFFSIIKDLKISNDEKWIDHYKTVALYTNNIGVILYQQKNLVYIVFYEELIQRCIEFEDLTPTILKTSLIEKAFNVICELHYKGGDFQKCMAFAALYCLLYLESNINIFHVWWIKSKVKAKQDLTIQTQTLIKSLELHEELLSKIVDTKNYLTRERKVQLLTFELGIYKLTYKSKLPIKEAFYQLVEIADMSKIASAIILIFGDGDMALHDDMPSLFNKIIKEIENIASKNHKVEFLMALAVLQYYNYKIVSKETVKKSAEEVEKNLLVVESAKEKFDPVPCDPNDVCDVVTAYDNLTMNKFLEVLDSLIKALDNISHISDDSMEPTFISSAVNLLMKMGLEFRLHCFSLKSLQAFELGLKFARKVSDKERQLLCIAFLIESANPHRKLIIEMISDGDALVKLLEEDDGQIDYNKSLAIYYLSKSKVFLYKDPQASYHAWKKASEILEAHKDHDEFGFLLAELYILDFKLTKSCHFIVGDHEKNPMTTKLHNALDIVCDLSRKDGLAMGTHERCILFDTVYELNKVYLLMRLPRDLRCYSKNSLFLTQRLLLPMRSVLFLVLLAHCDLLTCQIDNCNVKLNGIIDIFCLDQSSPQNESNEDVDQVANGVQHLSLEPTETCQLSPLSAYLPEKFFKLPEFLCHDISCICFFCTCLEYHQLLIDKYHLDALINMYKDNGRLATSYINGSLKLYKNLESNYGNYHAKIKCLISDDLIPDFGDYFFESYGNLLYDYSYHLSRSSRKSEALEVNTRLLEMLVPRKLEFVHLYSETLLQRLSYVTTESQARSSYNTKLSVTPNGNATLATTPKDKKSTVTVNVNSSYNISLPKQKVKKKAALFKSPAQTELKLIPSPVNAETEPSTPKLESSKKSDDFEFEIPKPKGTRRQLKLFETPVMGKIQTPKINIFTEEMEPVPSGRKSKRKQSANTRKPSKTEENERQNSSKKITRSRSSRMVLDVDEFEGSLETQENKPSSTVQIQQPVISRVTRTRGQVLAEKLKLTNIQSDANRNLKKNLTTDILNDKVKVPSRANNDNNSCISRSPEHDTLSARSKVLVEKLKKSTIKNGEVLNQNSARTGEKGTKVKKQLLREF